MNQNIADYIRTHDKEVFEDWIMHMEKNYDEWAHTPLFGQMYTNTGKEFVNLIVTILDKDENYQEKVENFAKHIFRIGWPLTFLTNGLRTFSLVIYEQMMKAGSYTAETVYELIAGFDKWLTTINNHMIQAYSATWERTVSLQKIALQELSAPLIPVFEKISIMPLVGTIDTDRAKLIMENLLTGVIKHQADVVLIDITGVPVVDTMVAHHIIQAADAVRLVGAKCMLVGIRPEIAQTIVNLGINLNEVITTSTLRKGIEQALEFTNRQIVEMEG